MVGYLLIAPAAICCSHPAWRKAMPRDVLQGRAALGRGVEQAEEVEPQAALVGAKTTVTLAASITWRIEATWPDTGIRRAARKSTRVVACGAVR